MKKIFYYAFAAIVSVGLVACNGKEEPTNGNENETVEMVNPSETDADTTPGVAEAVKTSVKVTLNDDEAEFEIEVDPITATTATVTVTPKTEKYSYYWDINYASAGTVAELAEANLQEIYEDYEEYKDMYADYGINSFEDLLEMGESDYDYEGLSPESEFVVFLYVVEMTNDVPSIVGNVAYTTFKTPKGAMSKNDFNIYLTQDTLITIKTANNDPYYMTILSETNYQKYEYTSAVEAFTEEAYWFDFISSWLGFDTEWYSGDLEFSTKDYCFETGKYTIYVGGYNGYLTTKEVRTLSFEATENMLGEQTEEEDDEWFAPQQVKGQHVSVFAKKTQSKRMTNNHLFRFYKNLAN